jgi:hypothetical protein
MLAKTAKVKYQVYAARRIMSFHEGQQLVNCMRSWQRSSNGIDVAASRLGVLNGCAYRGLTPPGYTMSPLCG